MVHPQPFFVRERSRALLDTRCVMKRKTKIPENVWNLLGTAAIIACLVLAAVAILKSFRAAQ